jgi:hypothetical protein
LRRKMMKRKRKRKRKKTTKKKWEQESTNVYAAESKVLSAESQEAKREESEPLSIQLFDS